MARIAVGGFQHETNTFAPQQATWEEFVRADAWPPLLRGPEMIAGVEGFNIPIAGAVKRLAELGHEVVPLAWAAAAPASYVTEDAYEKMWALFDEDLAKLGPFDAIYLDLHGAMVAENTEDGEGELLKRIRTIVGGAMPIVASLDYHANLTPDMASLATALVGYRTYPHIDMAVTGKRAAELLDRLLKEKRPVYRAYRQLDFLIPLVWQCTFIEPAKSIFDLVGELEAGEKSHNQGIVSVTHTPGFPPADIAQCGPALVVYGHDKEAVEAAADKLAQTVKAQERAFAGELLDPDAAALRAIELSKNAKKPIVLADVQDNPGAGGTSDTVGLLAALMRHKAKGAVIGMIVDEEAAKEAVGHRRGQDHASRHRRCRGLRRREAGRGRLARGQGRRRQVHRHRPVLRRRQVPDRPDGAGDRRGERRVRRACQRSASRRPTRRCSAMSASSPRKCRSSA